MGALSRGPLVGTLSTLVGGPWWGPLVGGGGLGGDIQQQREIYNM